HLARTIMEGAHDRDDIRSCGESLDVPLRSLKAQQLPDALDIRGMPMGVHEIHKLCPVLGIHLPQLTYVLLILPFGRYGDRNDVAGTKASQIEAHLARDKGAIELARCLPRGEHDELVL